MISYIIIAGPQASGKSTAKKHIEKTFKNVIVLEEAAEILLRQKGISGGAFVDVDFERDLLDFDLKKMRKCLEGRNVIYVDETNIFSSAHAKIRDPEVGEELFSGYVQMLNRFNTGIIFTHVNPEASLKRKETVYMKRYQSLDDFRHKMELSRKYILQIYPHLIDVFKRLDFPKEMVEGGVSLQEFEKNVEIAFQKVCSKMNVKVERN